MSFPACNLPRLLVHELHRAVLRDEDGAALGRGQAEAAGCPVAGAPVVNGQGLAPPG